MTRQETHRPTFMDLTARAWLASAFFPRFGPFRERFHRSVPSSPSPAPALPPPLLTHTQAALEKMGKTENTTEPETLKKQTLVLDLHQCYARLRATNGYFFLLVTQGWDASLHQALAAETHPPVAAAAAGNTAQAEIRAG